MTRCLGPPNMSENMAKLYGFYWILRLAQPARLFRGWKGRSVAYQRYAEAMQTKLEYDSATAIQLLAWWLCVL